MIALLTDFGDDYYAGILKGVILSNSKKATIIDLTHKIQAQNVRQGAWVLLQSIRYFPKHTIFLTIIDPGVGSSRNALVIESRNYFFVGPDNGLLYPAAKKDGILSITKLAVPKNSSKTFQGRDLFAKCCAQLENGIKPKELGVRTPSMQELSFLEEERRGEVVHIDTFGNIITNLKSQAKKQYTLVYNKTKTMLPFYDTYSSAPPKTFFLITGSSNTLEISIKDGSACSALNINLGDTIEIS